jgi:hypothetical protein
MPGLQVVLPLRPGREGREPLDVYRIRCHADLRPLSCLCQSAVIPAFWMMSLYLAISAERKT